MIANYQNDQRATGEASRTELPPSVPAKYRAVILLLLFSAGVVNFFDRASLSVANTTIRAEMHWSGTQIGWLLSAFSLAYGFAQLPLLSLIGRFGTRRLLAGGLALWSAAQMLTALVRGLGPFLALRVLLGAGEAPFYPCGVHGIREWFPAESRARATALMSMSQTLALAAAPPVLTIVMLHFGWRWMFASLGIAGLLVSAAWMRWYRDRNGLRVTAVPITAGAQPSTWRLLLRFRTMWGMMLGWSGINYTVWLYVAWVPGYLQTGRHLNLARSGWLAAIPFLFGAFGMAISGLLSDRLARAGLELATVHRANLVAGMLLSAVSSFVVGRSESTAMAVGGISAALFFVHFAGTSGWGYVQTVGGERYAGPAGALMNFASFIVASAAPVITGWLLDRTHSFSIALELCSVIMLLGALSYATLGKPPVRGTFGEAALD